MEKLEFSVTIDASPEKVWSILFGKDTYPEWTAVWSKSSRVETDWKKGSKALFLDGENCGMVSEIAESIPYEFLSIRHLGEVKNGIEDTKSEKVKEWSGLVENYTLKPADGKTELQIYSDMPESFVGYMKEIWPKALQLVKGLVEK